MHALSVAHASAEGSERGQEFERNEAVSEQSQETPSTSAGRKLFLGGLNAQITEAVLAVRAPSLALFGVHVLVLSLLPTPCLESMLTSALLL